MEHPGSKESIKNKPLRLDYSRVMDIVYLSLCCNDNVEGSLRAGSFSELFPDETDREQHKAEFGARFDDEMINFVATVMALRRKNVIIDMGEDHGITQDNRFYWEEGLQSRLRLLNKKRKSSDKLTVQLAKAPLPENEGVQVTSELDSSESLAMRHDEERESGRGVLAA